MFLSAQDRLQELFGSDAGSTVAVFPNMNLVRRLCKKYQGETFSIDLVFACHASSDPNDLVLDLLGRFAADFRFIQEVSYLVELPEKTFRKQQPYVAYTVKVTNVLQDSFDLHWCCQAASRYEALIPKVIAEVPDIHELLHDEHGPLTCKSIKRNGCSEIANGGNCFPYVFSSSCFDHVAMNEAVKELVSKCRHCAADFPSSVIQVKSGVNWNTTESVEKSVIFLRSLESTQILELAQQLTLNRVDFFLPSPNIIVLDLVGISTSSLIRLLHYSEVPVPTSMVQGAFSLSFLNWGRSMKSERTSSRSCKMQHFKVSCGRITALQSAPMQIKWEEVQQLCEPSLEQSSLAAWVKAELSGSCLKKVLAINEERTVDWYLQFQVPQKFECTFPKQVAFGKKKLLVDHALPFAPTRSNISRPPIEESMHDHWKNTASLAPAQKKNRSNCIAHLEGCFPSLQRVNMLQEISVKSRGLRVAGSFEASSAPLLFFNGRPELADGLQAFVDFVGSVPDIAADVDHSVERYLAQPDGIIEFTSHSAVLYGRSVQCTDQVPLNIGRIFSRRNGCVVSTTELLKCHAYTECLLIVMLPKGVRVDSFCTPKRHFEVIFRIPICPPKERLSKEQASLLTPLGENPMLSLDQGSGGSFQRREASEDSQDAASDVSPSHESAANLDDKVISDPQPVAVGGCGDSLEVKEHVAYFESGANFNGEPRCTPHPAGFIAEPRVGNREGVVQPVAVDGIGGLLSCDIHKHPKEHGNSDVVTPTVEWTEMPSNPPSLVPTQAEKTIPHSNVGIEPTQAAVCTSEGKGNGRNVNENPLADTSLVSLPRDRQKDACFDGAQERVEGSKPWVNALSTSDILTPIPEIEVSADHHDKGVSSTGGVKPKALPVKVSHTARKGLAKLATPKSRPTRTQALLDGYVHGRTVPAEAEPATTLGQKAAAPQGLLAEKEHRAKHGPVAGTQTTCNQNHSTISLPKPKSIQRSKSAGQPPSTPGRRTGTSGNSKSCPPARLKASPLKEVIKHGGKARKELVGASGSAKGGLAEKDDKRSGPRLRRAGMDTTRKLDFFQGSKGLHQHGQTSTVFAKKDGGDVPMIDVEKLIAADEVRKQALAVEQVRDASTKWLGQYPVHQRESIEQLAVNFLLAMNSTLCFFTVAMRMLSKAPWTEAMISLDVRQVAMVAISRGWFVKCDSFSKYPFTRAELALAAGAYQGLLLPAIPDDTTVALRTIIDHLPHSCSAMFTQAEVVCPFCKAKKNGIVPTFSCSTSWKEEGWVDLKTALGQAQPFLGYLPKGWHHEGCDRDDQSPTVVRLGKWLYLELRPYPVLDHAFFPSLTETVPLLSDDSLCAEGLCIDSFVCSNLGAGEGRHYWLVEVLDGRMQQAYDSLQGVQPLTQEVYKKLQVTGVLLRAAGSGKPTMRNLKLDQLAGKVDAVQIRQQTIRVASRSRTYKLRQQLIKSMSNLAVTPVKPKFGPVCAESAEGKGAMPCRRINSSCQLVGRQHFPASIAHGRKTHQVRKIRGSLRRRAHNPNTSKALPLGHATDKKNDLQNGGVAIASVTLEDQNLRLKGGRAPLHSSDLAANHDLGGAVISPDPISNFSSQTQVSAGSPSRSKKRSFDQAGLEQDLLNHEASEDVVRRNNGPPKADIKAAQDRESPRACEPDAEKGGQNLGCNCPPVQGSKKEDECIQVLPPFCENSEPPVESPANEVKTVAQECQHSSHGTARCRAQPVAVKECTDEQHKSVALLAPNVNQPALGDDLPPSELKQVAMTGHQDALRTACCRAQPVNARVDNDRYLQVVNPPSVTPDKGKYGVISLFDGVSTVIPILKKKFGYPPVAAILAECDLSLRELVCTEFGYRSDEKWGYTIDGSAVLYLKDVHGVINHNCRLLKELTQMFPGCKWIIVGGSPCQDLTFAGPLRGALGLVGPSSRLFFVLLCVIYTMQGLVGTEAVRYLVENAASMLQIHLDAFCRLLSLHGDPQSSYVWDPWDLVFQITGKRNYFRNFDDTEEIVSPLQVFDHKYGPLVDLGGNCVPFAPLLRTRQSLPYGMLRSSWTLYQPHALVWDYAYWNGKASFGKACKLGTNKLPHLRWELDAILSPLLPLFHCESYSVPLHILKEEEVAALSGLHGVWTRISPEDAEALPEQLVRDYCGNCFHPALISSALGNNDVLRRWVSTEHEGPKVRVADQTESFRIFAQLCDQVESEVKHRVKSEKVNIDRTLPPFQTVEPCHRQQIAPHADNKKPDVLPPSMAGCRKVKVTKANRHLQHCIDAALHKLEEHQCLALRLCGLERIFDGLRAPCFVPFQFQDYCRCVVGEDPAGLRQFAVRFPLQCPRLQQIEAIRTAFQLWNAHPSLCTLMAVLIAGSELKKGSSWPVGHVLLLPGQDTGSVCYLGDAAPKLLLLVNAARPQAPQVYVVEATAYRNALPLKHLPVACQCWWPATQLHPDKEFSVELRDGQGLLNVGPFHCQQESCLTCFLAKNLQLAFCPWHAPPTLLAEQEPLSVTQFLCTKNLSTSTIDLVGQIKDTPNPGSIYLFHVCTSEQIHQLGSHLLPFPRVISLFHSSLSEAILNDEHLSELSLPFRHTELPREIYRHLFVRAGGPASALDVWLRERSLEP